MPIQFRCAYCAQLMSIARRKAGTVVSCPKCQGQVIVPKPEGEPAAAASPQTEPAKKSGNLFEQEDFSRYLQPPRPQAFGGLPPAAAPVQQPLPHALPPVHWPEAAAGPALPRGLYLTPGLLALMGVLVVLLMGLAFFLGLLLGRSG